MKKAIFVISAALLCTGCSSGDIAPQERSDVTEGGSVMRLMLKEANEPTDGYEPLNFPVQKGIWMSYIDLAPMLSSGDGEEFREKFDKACDNICELGCNTVYVHVRPFGDAAYKSEMFPESAYVGGDYDPLEIMCQVAHSHELSIHAWINPLRLQTPEELLQINEDYETAHWYRSGQDFVKAVEGNGHLWLDPGYPEVRKLIAQGAAEIAEGYEVDGIHYDDYFYPTTDGEFDVECFKELGEGRDLEEWRLSNISEMCSLIYKSVKDVAPKIQVGISPQGNIENNYIYMYADVERWAGEEGFCDYILPQLYYGWSDPVKPFEPTLDTWIGMGNESTVRLIAGLGAYKIGQETEFTDTPGIISAQLRAAREAGCSGAAVYTYGSFFVQDGYISPRMEQEGSLIREEFDAWISD